MFWVCDFLMSTKGSDLVKGKITVVPKFPVLVPKEIIRVRHSHHILLAFCLIKVLLLSLLENVVRIKSVQGLMHIIMLGSNVLLLQRRPNTFMIIVGIVELAVLRVKYLCCCSELLRTCSVTLGGSRATSILSVLTDLVHLGRFIDIEVGSFFLVNVEVVFAVALQCTGVIEFLFLVFLHYLFVVLISHWGMTHGINPSVRIFQMLGRFRIPLFIKVELVVRELVLIDPRFLVFGNYFLLYELFSFG
jgi:hypothetical protein